VSRKQILPAAKRAFLNAQERYRAGRVNLHDLLNAQEILIDVRLSLLVTVRDLNSSFALLHRAAGLAIKVE
jgi:outer membrane protein TolC